MIAKCGEDNGNCNDKGREIHVIEERGLNIAWDECHEEEIGEDQSCHEDAVDIVDTDGSQIDKDSE